jgi:hypothetical protein
VIRQLQKEMKHGFATERSVIAIPIGFSQPLVDFSLA